MLIPFEKEPTMVALEVKQEQIVDFQQASLEFTAAVSEPMVSLSA